MKKTQTTEVTLPDFLEIRKSIIHGTGVFATKKIPKGKLVIQYVGRIVDKKESDNLCEGNNPYIFYIDEKWDLDGSVEWNPARFINHSCNPNCEVEQDDDNQIWIHAIKKIMPGEELSYNYGYDLESYKDYPCRCQASNCIGYMVAEEHQPTVLRNQALISS